MNPRTPKALVCLTAALLTVPATAPAIDYNFAGSLQLDYLYTPFARSDPRPSSHTLDGFTEELSLKLAVDISAHASAHVKFCYGCHGIEADMAYFDYRFADELNLRVGRFNPTFGEFGLRHDPGNHRLNDKPLPYDMGRMLRMIDFDRSVLPSPYVDNGVELSGSHFFGRSVQLDYAAHVVAGLRAPTDRPYDVDFQSMRQAAPYYIDNNSQPSFGGRLGATFRLGERTDLTLGSSILYGAYDTRARMNYLVLGADAFLRMGRTNLRAEFLVRRTEMYAAEPGRFAFEVPTLADGTLPERIFSIKEGWYIELEQPISRRVELMLRWDGLRRLGNVSPNNALEFDAGISRWTIGANYLFERAYRIKLSIEHYQYWGLRSGVTQDLAAHLGAVATF